MRLGRSVTFLAFILCTPAISRAQCGDPPDPWHTWRDYVRVCHKYGGHISHDRCVDWDTNWCRRDNQPQPLTPEQQEEQRRRLQAEAEQEAEIRRQQELDRQQRLQDAEAVLQREHDEQERQRRQFIADRDIASSQLKSTANSTNSGLKETGDKPQSFALKSTGSEETEAILRGIRKIQVPPPIPPDEATFAIGELAPRDETSKNVLLGLDVGVAAVDVVVRVGKTSMPWVKLIVATGKVVIADENAADVYLVQQTAVYEQALKYLKDEKERKEFTAIVRARKQHQPIPENASIDMVRAADAILDPKVGNSGMRIAWNAMLSPGARRAAVTEACIQLGSEILGQTAGHAFQRLQATQQPAFREAEDFLEHAAVAMKRVEDPVAKASLRIAIEEANQTIAGTYRTLRPAVVGLEHLEHIYAEEAEEEYRTKKP